MALQAVSKSTGAPVSSHSPFNPISILVVAQELCGFIDTTLPGMCVSVDLKVEVLSAER